jgi:exopolysaccharide biosynthesis polyprenyl glycosylphosphotransferase
VTIHDLSLESEAALTSATDSTRADVGLADRDRKRQPATARAKNRRGALVRRALLLSDVIALTAAYAVACAAVRSGFSGVLLLATLPAWTLGAKVFGLYDRDEQNADHVTIDDLGPLFRLLTIGSFLGLAVSWAAGIDGVTVGAVVVFWATAAVLVAVGRSLARSAVRRQAAFPQNTIIVGAGDVGQLIGRKLLQHAEFGINLVGFVDAEPKRMREDVDHIPLLGGPDEIAEIVRVHAIDRVVVAFSNDGHDQLLELVRTLRPLNVHIDLVPRLFEAVGPAVGIHAVEGLPLVGLPASRPSRLASRTKRTVDIVGASLALVLMAPLFAWIALRVRRDSHGPVFFRQTRLGEDMQPFTLLKFRTMTVDVDDGPHLEYLRQIMDPAALPTANNLYKLNRDDSVTRAGRWLRRTSLDEMPQLVNVIRGDMSLVGPRPCIPYETELFESHHYDRFLVPAGMTGLWQVAARAHSTFKEALDLDAAYARNWSLKLDLWLLARTPIVLFRDKETT